MTKAELLAIIHLAKEKQWVKLDLSGQGITELPPEIGQLQALQVLNLGQNQLSQLPPEIEQLQALQSLHLWENQLIQLPPGIGQLQALRGLYLGGNQLSQLPPEIGQLQALQSLELWENQLSQLPPEIGRLQALQKLSLGGNQLSHLPPEIGRLQALQSLDLWENQLSELPPEIGQLQALQVLNLGQNQLSYLPLEIGQLQALQGLDLTENQLGHLPSEIGRLQALQDLNLWDNHLNHLPSEIGRLQTLQQLSLGGNQLINLPSEIVQLQALQRLDLSNNPLNDSVKYLNLLNTLRVLDLRDTQLSLPTTLARLKKQSDGIYIPHHSPALPEEFLQKYSAEIYDYLTEGKGQLLPLNEAKLLLLGDGTVGKSSLVHHLLHNKFAKKTKTEGIDRLQWKNVPVNGQQIRLNIWDFGGQEILHATHQFFLTKRSIYILVLDARHGEQESRLEYWLKLIQSFGGDSPVLVVTNKTDEEHRLTLNHRFLQDKYPNIIGFYPTSCRTGAGIPELKARIIDTVAKLPHIHDQMPASWFKLKKSLEKRKENYLSYEAYQALCAQQKITATDSQNTLCGFLHDLGIVLNFRDDDRFDRLRETNVLNPEWVTNAAYKLLNNVELCKNHGVFSKSDLANLLDAKSYPSPKEHQFIIDMLQKFEMCFPLADTASDYLIPQLLHNNEPDLGWDKANSLRFEYHYDILPHSVFSRCIVRLHEIISQKTYWRTGVVLQLDGNKALVTADIEDKKIFIWVSGNPATRRELLAIIRKELQHIHRTIKGLSAKARIPHEDITVDYQHLLFLESIGQTTYFPEGLKEEIQVQALLSGVDLPKTQPAVTINQNITNSTIHGSVLAAEAISNCLNTVQQANTAPDLKAVLNELLENIKALNNQATATQAPLIETLSRETETLITEIASPQPRKPYALLSLKGIKEAAISLEAAATPILTVAEKIGGFLQTMG